MQRLIMTYKLKVIMMITALTTLIAYGCAGDPIPEPEESVASAPVEDEDNVVSIPDEPEEDVVHAPAEDESAGASGADVDGSTGASIDPDVRPDVNKAATIVSGAEAREIYEKNDPVILLDVRNQDEFDEMSIPGSTLIPVGELESRLSELPDKKAVIIVFCKAGVRSETASDILTKNGYANVFNMKAISNWR